MWVVDHCPTAWSFHYLHAVPKPKGFPPSSDDLQIICEMGQKIVAVFSSRLISVDFARDRKGKWHFMEAGPGATGLCQTESICRFTKANQETPPLLARQIQGQQPTALTHSPFSFRSRGTPVS